MVTERSVSVEVPGQTSDVGSSRVLPERREVRAALEAMQHNLGHPWSIAELVRTAHTSGSHLMRLFAQELGMAPTARLTRRRIQEIARLLRETRLSILEMARQAG